MAILRFKRGGVSPLHNIHEGKDLAANEAISPMDAPEVVHIPLTQSIGAPNEPVVKAGDEVLVGQVLAQSEAFVSAPVHSSVSGKVKNIANMPGTMGTYVPHAIIENDGEYRLDASITDRGESEIAALEAKDIIDIVRQAGIVGEGGATFPSHVKLSIPPEKKITELLINGAECEPYLTADYRLMLEDADTIMRGIGYLMKALGVDKAIVGIEDNKPEAIKTMQQAASNYKGIVVETLRTRYPQGAEKQLIEALVGRQVPRGGKLPMDAGVVVFNVGTCTAVCRAVENRMPLIERVVTVTGDVNKPANLKIKTGTSFLQAVEHCGGYTGQPGKIISGGPMMGVAQYTDEVRVTKGSSGILVFNQEKADVPDELNCMRCGKCVNVCPQGLVPLMIDQYARKHNWEMTENYDAMECTECGCCSYICPSKRQLTQTIRISKNIITKQRREEQEAKNNG